MQKRRRLALGMDLGGTSIKVGVVTCQGTIVGRGLQLTEAYRGVADVVDNMVKAAKQAMEEAEVTPEDLEGVGIGAPGTCDGPRGIVVSGTNLGWQDVPLAAMVQDALGLPSFLDNDANCAALGEQWCGAGVGSQHMLMLTLGTGVGGGLILDGRIYHGARGWAGEFGHMPVVGNGTPCNCGRRGCLETVASASAIAREAQHLIDADQAPLLAKRAAAQGRIVDARLVISAARDGDPVACQILRTAGGHLGWVVAALVGALNPERVVVGGGVAEAGDLILEPLRVVVRERAMPGPESVVSVIPAALGNDAGLVGAASLVWR